METKKLSIVDAAFKVLCETADGPLNCSQLIEKMAKAGYWKPHKGGRTPANTLSAGLLREIKTKGDKSRFEKVARGQFGIKKT